jgi:hypothetical protein
MIGRIEVYIKNEDVAVSQGVSRPAMDHPCLDRELLQTERVTPESDRLALMIAEEFANQNELSLNVYDVHTLRGKIRATLKGIKKTPTIIIGESRIEGTLAPELIRAKLESCLTE